MSGTDAVIEPTDTDLAHVFFFPKDADEVAVAGPTTGAGPKILNLQVGLMVQLRWARLFLQLQHRHTPRHTLVEVIRLLGPHHQLVLKKILMEHHFGIEPCQTCWNRLCQCNWSTAAFV